MEKPSKKTFKLIRKFARTFGYDYKRMKKTFTELDKETKKDYVNKMNVFLKDLEEKKVRARDVNLLPHADPVADGSNLL